MKKAAVSRLAAGTLFVPSADQLPMERHRAIETEGTGRWKFIFSVSTTGLLL
jgi:hypothetical protein